MRTCKLAIAFAAIALLATTLDVSAQETVTVEPAAVVSWQEMLDSESARSARGPSGQ